MRIKYTKNIVLAGMCIGVLSAFNATPARADDTAVKLQTAIDKGLHYLQLQQKPDGGWQRSDKEPPAITAIALRAFVQDSKYTSKTDFVARGFDKLLSFQTADGGIYKDLLANYNTAIAVSTLVRANDPAFKSRIDDAVAYLKRLQWTTETRPEYPGKTGEKVPETNTAKQVVKGSDDPFYGGWGYGGRSRGGGRPDLSNTQLAIDALYDAGVSKDDPAMQNAIQFVTRCQNFSEANDQSWAGNDGGFAYGPSDDRTGESFAGSYTDTEGKRRLHSMGSMTYAGLKSMIYAGLTKDDPRVRAAWGWVNKNFTLDGHPGMSELSDEKAKWGLFYYYMTVGRALAAYGEPTLTGPNGQKIDWRIALADKAVELQQPDGSWVGVNKYMEDNPILVTAYTILALQEARHDLAVRPGEASAN
jgi:squalene-hopene/tetraprenyl-beta-curcumene cyclase